MRLEFDHGITGDPREAGSSRFSSSQITAVSIPKLVCEHCYQEAREKFEELKKKADLSSKATLKDVYKKLA